MKFVIATILAALLAGCATFDSSTFLDNRVACTLGRDKAFVVSQWGAVGISSTIAEPDRAVICAK